MTEFNYYPIGKHKPPNPLGNPNIGKARKTGAITEEGKFWQTINRVSDDTTSKIINALRKCDKCPLKPQEINGRQILRCPYWEAGKTECIIPMGNFLTQCRILRTAQKEGLRKLAEHIAVKSAMYSELAFQKDMIMEGTPSTNTMNYQKLVGEQINNLLKVEEGEKLNINQNISSVSINADMTMAIREAQQEMLNENGEIIFDDEVSDDGSAN